MAGVVGCENQSSDTQSCLRQNHKPTTISISESFAGDCEGIVVRDVNTFDSIQTN